MKVREDISIPMKIVAYLVFIPVMFTALLISSIVYGICSGFKNGVEMFIQNWYP